MAHRVSPEDLRAVCDPASLGFESTEHLAPLEGMIGQDRAVTATAFGVRAKRDGYNMFVLGPPATGKSNLMQRVLAAAAQDEPVPPDCCYVHNFATPDRPRALILPPGRAVALRDEMARLVEECKTRLPRAFESEEFERQKAKILEELAEQQNGELKRLEEIVQTAGFALLRTPGGLAVAPAFKGKPLAGEEFAKLPEDVRERIAAAAGQLEERVEATLREVRQHEREARAAHQRLVRATAAAATRQLIREIREAFAGISPVQEYLDQVEEDLVEHAEEFRAVQDGKPALPFLPSPGAFLDRYRVNVLVDRTGSAGAPVVFERNPTHGNLVGRVEHRAQFGTLVTDFTLIKAGALHRANGGYLILEAKDVLRGPLTWETLKKALKSRTIRIEEPLEEFRLVSTVSLVPEPVPLAVKVVLLGSPLLYYLLYNLDEDFGELFKVKVDFDDSLPRTPEIERLYARFVADVCREERLRPVAAGGVASLIEEGSRLVGHQERLSARLGVLRDVVREAALCAEERGHPLVEGDDVTHAITQRIYRANLIEERMGRMFREGTLLLATGGAALGQVNGISVLSTGDHRFGRPARITARTYAGQPGVVDIEREVKLGGPVHSKGVLILGGFLAGRYARERPLALSASIAFEQQYEEVEGDSAASAELYALLSSLSGLPLSQAIAVTGSVNQQGEIQPVGGVNEKIEGFFDVCRERGLTGEQGVMIPGSNVRHLMLRGDVVEAVRQGRFHVWTVSTVDEGIELLTGRPAGVAGPGGQYPPDSVNAAVAATLAANVERLRELRAGPHGLAGRGEPA